MEKGKIRRLQTELPEELKDAQEFFISEVEDKTEEYLDKYFNLESSYQGRYICSDLFKETFERYTESIDSRKKYSQVIHNSCAVLAGELYNRTMVDPKYKNVIFLTGVPGAGKSYLIQSLAFAGILDDETIVYEGDVTTPSIREKMQLAKDNNKDLYMIVVNPTLELAQENAIRRHFEIGRGASCATMARIMSKLPSAVEQLTYEFDVMLSVFNKRTNHDVYHIIGVEEDNPVLDHGTYEEIYDRLMQLREELLPQIEEEFQKKKLAEQNGEEYIEPEVQNEGKRL